MEIEFGAVIKSFILKNKNGNEFVSGRIIYLLGDHVQGNPDDSTVASVYYPAMIKIGENTPGKLAGFTHTHPNQWGHNSEFSGGDGLFSGDMSVSEYFKVPIYMSNNSGEVLKGTFSKDFGDEGHVVPLTKAGTFGRIRN